MNPASHQIKIKVGEHILTASLENHPASQDFIDMLPLQLTLEDYAGIEKVSQLPGRLNIEGRPAGHQAAIGDITYYAPWGNLAIFYKPFRYAEGLVKLGQIQGDISVLTASESVQVHIELWEEK